jgi:hypothetical protein
MKRAFHFGFVVALIVAGCGGEEPKDDTNKTLLELKISTGVVRTITVTEGGAIAEVISPSKATGRLKPTELQELKGLASKVEWAKVPGEGFKTADGNPVAGGRSYDLTYNGITPPKTVHSMDGATEDANFKTLRDTIENDANKIGK